VEYQVEKKGVLDFTFFFFPSFVEKGIIFFDNFCFLFFVFVFVFVFVYIYIYIGCFLTLKRGREGVVSFFSEHGPFL